MKFTSAFSQRVQDRVDQISTVAVFGGDIFKTLSKTLSRTVSKKAKQVLVRSVTKSR